jgi:Alpha/beta hydrolase domain
MMRLVLCAMLVSVAVPARAVVPTPTVIGPITSPGGAFITPPSSLVLSQFGYVEEEFFVAGTARAQTTVNPLGADGNWTATPDGATAPY